MSQPTFSHGRGQALTSKQIAERNRALTRQHFDRTRRADPPEPVAPDPAPRPLKPLDVGEKVDG